MREKPSRDENASSKMKARTKENWTKTRPRKCVASCVGTGGKIKHSKTKTKTGKKRENHEDALPKKKGEKGK